jgi:putative thioredoxin
LKPLTQMDERVGALNAKLELAKGAADAPSEQGLHERIAKDGSDLEARLQLAHTHVGQKNFREALEQLLAIVERDRGFREDVGRKTILQVFELLGNQGELVSEFRKRLARTMN